MNLTTFRQFHNEPVLNPWSDEGMKRNLLGGIEKARAFLHSAHKVLVGETWVPGNAGTYTTKNPNNREEAFGPFSVSDESQARAALDHAQKIFLSWSVQPYGKRAQLVRQIRKKFAEERWTLIGFLMLEIGKTALEAHAEWAEAVDFLDYYANSCELLHDRDFLAVTDMQGHRNRLLAKPLGVGVSLPPFNFPCAIFTGMWAAPTVMGNVMVVKPSPRAPATGIYCAKIFQEAGAPVQLVLDSGVGNHALGKFLVEDPDVALVTFTGSKRAGLEINKAAARTSARWIKRVVAEMGGCDFIAVHDVNNLDQLLDAIETSATGFQGQKCSALSRLIIKEDIYDDIKQGIVERLSKITLKDVLEPSSMMGGVIDERSLTTIDEQCRQVVQAGGKFLVGGKPENSYPGYGIPISLHEGLDPYGEMASVEIFGPVFGIYKARNFDELVKIANVTPYALTGSLFTEDPKLQARISEFSSGNTYLNRKCTGAYVGTQPFGGWYGSGTDDKAGHWSHLLRFLQWQTVSEKM
ncbi:MAG: hypothetical protein A3I05_05680 [Deltaproteobacteria bacterium RIFCSPLOWO2_02_FULL_44_10]|nr:MAG: hypothetical protein A3C46_04505 [Deltaproteobacteria bacterium RIFCSPHIGHO2_02_FULL_44_16]OGQ46102.1 MAG: hypothetical protein A3I05_05680 [Deltaproteobacteria bacterium RIFCSPLOWO2_02_FULL_44_10]